MMRALIPAVFTFVVLCAPAVHAQPTGDQRLLAETLFQEGRRLMDAKRWPEACDRFEESHRIEPLAGVLLNLAVCHEKEGRTATAWSEFKQALALAKIDRRADRRALAERHIAALEPRLARLRIEVTRPLPELRVFDGETELPPAIWATDRPVDPGPHTIVVEAPGHEGFSSTMEAQPAETVTVVVPPLTPVAPEPPPAPPPAPVLPAPAARTPAPSSPTPVPAQPREDPAPGFEWDILGYSLVGLGAAGGMVGASFGIAALVRERQADARCDESTCPDEESLALSEEANDLATGANVSLAVGAVLAGAGVLTVLLAPDDDVTVAVGPGQLFVAGHF